MSELRLFTNEFGIEGYRMAFFDASPELFFDVCKQYSSDIPDDTKLIRIELPFTNEPFARAGQGVSDVVRIVVESEKFLLFGDGQPLERINPTFNSYQCECGKTYPIRADQEYCPYCGRKHGKETN